MKGNMALNGTMYSIVREMNLKIKRKKMDKNEIGNVENSTVVGGNVSGENHQIEANMNSGSNERYSELNYWKILWPIIVGALVFFIICVTLNKMLNFGISDNAVVLAFVGIAATFVVVSNYAQVAQIKQDMEDRLNKAISGQNTASRINMCGVLTRKIYDARKFINDKTNGFLNGQHPIGMEDYNEFNSLISDAYAFSREIIPYVSKEELDLIEGTYEKLKEMQGRYSSLFTYNGKLDFDEKKEWDKFLIKYNADIDNLIQKLNRSFVADKPI